LPQPLRSEIARLAAPWRALPVNVKWVPEQNYHLTLKFLGSITPGEGQALSKHLQALALRSSFLLSVGGWGMFPSIKRPNVFWMGMGGELEALQDLWRELDDRLSASGYPRDRHFHPHLTLGRFRSPANVDSLVARLQQTPALNHVGTFPVNSLQLMESKLGPAGPSYRALSSYEFKA